MTLLNGVCVFRTVPAGFRAVDAAAVLPHAHALGLTTVGTVTRIDARAYVERAEGTGEVLPGVEAVPARESFKVGAGPAK